MSCINNPKRFWWVKYYGPHKEKIVRFGKFMSENDFFMVQFECESCGAQRISHFVKEEELLEMGVSIDKIIAHRATIF
jgi:hypothetical protein